MDTHPREAPWTETTNSWGSKTVYFADDMDGKYHGGVKYGFNKWDKEDQLNVYFPPDNRADTLTIINGISKIPKIIAGYKRLYNLTLENQFTGVPTQGKIKFAGTTYTMGVSTPLVKELLKNKTYKIEAVNQTINGIAYLFLHWSDGNPSRVRNIAISSDESFKAVFLGKPQKVTNMRYIGAVGQPIKIQWDIHPNSYCYYNIYRSTKNVHTGEIITTLVATVPHNTTTWQDNLFVRTYTYSGYLLYYDPRAVYTVENTFADAYFGNGAFGDIFFNTSEADSSQKFPEEFSTEKQGENTLSVYPNPFNPQTNIRYLVQKSGPVEISIYDIRGRRIRTLLSANLGVGNYVEKWDGTKQSGQAVSSGVYLLSVKINGRLFVQKLMMVK